MDDGISKIGDTKSDILEASILSSINFARDVICCKSLKKIFHIFLQSAFVPRDELSMSSGAIFKEGLRDVLERRTD